MQGRNFLQRIDDNINSLSIGGGARRNIAHMKKYAFLVFTALNIFFFSLPAMADTCSIPSDSILRSHIRQYATACGGEGDFARRFSPECTDYYSNPATEANRAAFQAICPTATPCGCLRVNTCTSDPLYSEISCTPVRPPETQPETQPARCGDGIVQTARGEQCEPPLTGNCNEVCQWSQSKCGDGRVDFGTGEECEPPATIHEGWECNDACKVKKVPPGPKCGDGALNQTSEECEPAGTITCDANCKTIKFCGDGLVQTELGEQCERPNTATCDSTCKKIAQENPLPRCGDGILQTDRGEQCETAGVGDCSDTCKIIPPGDTALVQETLELLLEGSGMKCSLALQAMQSNPWQAASILILSFGSLSGFWMMRRKK